jgi:hypothetical protein
MPRWLDVTNVRIVEGGQSDVAMGRFLPVFGLLRVLSISMIVASIGVVGVIGISLPDTVGTILTSG